MGAVFQGNLAWKDFSPFFFPHFCSSYALPCPTEKSKQAAVWMLNCLQGSTQHMCLLRKDIKLNCENTKTRIAVPLIQKQKKLPEVLSK